jgi:pimeloyl-ACP methyl ester carboxylesterase
VVHSRMHRPRRPVLVAILLAAVLTIPGGAASAAGPGAAPTGPAAALDWSPCTPSDLAGFECGTLTVPLDWGDTGDGTIDLAVARHRTTGKASSRIGSLLFNPGGPGMSGVADLPVIWDLLPSAAKARFDLVTWDPRGMGSSSPLQGCETVPMTLPDTGPVDWPAVYAATRTARAAANAACMDRNATIVAHMGTMQAVHDLEALRAAVGDEQITYWGMSYGTRIGYAYARTFPDHLRAIVLDGSIDPNSSIVDLAWSGSARDTAIGYFFELYPKAAASYRRVRAALDTRTVSLPSGDELTRWGLDSLIDHVAGGESGYPLLAQVLEAADTATFGTGADADGAKALLDEVHLDQTVRLAGPAFSLVNCIDYPDRPTAAEQDAIATSLREQAPMVGWLQGFNLASMCAGFDGAVDPVPTEFGSDWSAPLLLVGTTRDAATPYTWTANMATAFRASRVITYVGAKHVVYGAGLSTCVNRHVSAYLIDLRRPARDVACPGVAKPAG